MGTRSCSRLPQARCRILRQVLSDRDVRQSPEPLRFAPFGKGPLRTFFELRIWSGDWLFNRRRNRHFLPSAWFSHSSPVDHSNHSFDFSSPACTSVCRTTTVAGFQSATPSRKSSIGVLPPPLSFKQHENPSAMMSRGSFGAGVFLGSQ
jgi:hypothetical protein